MAHSPLPLHFDRFATAILGRVLGKPGEPNRRIKNPPVDDKDIRVVRFDGVLCHETVERTRISGVAYERIHAPWLGGRGSFNLFEGNATRLGS